MPATADHHVELRPFLAEHLSLVQPWFEDPEVRHRLGGPEWPERALQLQARRRGRRRVPWHEGAALAHLAGLVTRRAGRLPRRRGLRPLDDVRRLRPRPVRVVTGPSSPDRRWAARTSSTPLAGARGFGVAVLRAWVEAPEVADVRVFALGVEHDNLASTRCAVAAGFVPDAAGAGLGGHRAPS